MRRTTIKQRIFTYNLLVLLLFVAMTAIIFNVAIKVYIEKDLSHQMTKIAERAEKTVLKQGPDFFPRPNGEREDRPKLPPIIEGPGGKPLMGTDLYSRLAQQPRPILSEAQKDKNELFRFYFMLDRSLREPLSVLNADYVLLDRNKNKVISPEGEYFKVSPEILKAIAEEIDKKPDGKDEISFNRAIAGGDYIAVIRPVSAKNDFGLSWIVVYSSLQKINQLQMVINSILLGILLITGIISALFSSFAARKIAEPFSALNEHLNDIAGRNFGGTLTLEVDDELKGFVSNINKMSVALAEYDKAQKTFLQNASHEFRTPLMSIQGHAEGIQYEVMEPKSAAKIILEESKRMTRLVEDLLYLSRLEALEESYRFEATHMTALLKTVKERMSIIAEKYGVLIKVDEVPSSEIPEILGDEEKLIRAVSNIVSNGCRHAEHEVLLTLEKDVTLLRIVISDDGPGFGEEELPHLFDRFYKGAKGDFGLGLAIAKSVVERHGGQITASNGDQGARVVIELPKGV